MAASTLAVPQVPASSGSEFQEQNINVPTNLYCIGDQLDLMRIGRPGFPDVNGYCVLCEGVGNEAK